MRAPDSPAAGLPESPPAPTAAAAPDLSPDRAVAALSSSNLTAPITPTTTRLPTPPPPTSPGDSLATRMTPTGGGTYEHRRPAFRAHIARDGTVAIRDEPNLHADIGLPCLGCLAADFEAWKKDPYHHTVNLAGLLPVLRGGFDLTDWIERVAGNDPYQYEKAKFLDATRERRAAMSATERRERTRDALARLPDFLDALWRDDRLPEADRLYLLFKLWDECEETGAGAHARATILSFIRKRTPGFTDEQLERLDGERTSEQPFSP